MKKPRLSLIEWIMLIFMNVSITILAVIAIPSHGRTIEKKTSIMRNSSKLENLRASHANSKHANITSGIQ